MKTILRLLLTAFMLLSVFLLPPIKTSAVNEFQVIGANVFGDYLESGDWLVVLTYKNMVTPEFPAADPSQYYYLQLIDTDNVTVIAQSSLAAWGYRPGSIYLSANMTNALQWGVAYSVNMTGITSGNSTGYTLAPEDWRSLNLLFLNRWVTTQATLMGTFDSATYTTSTINGLVLNTAGGVIFDIGIPGLSQVRPSLFESATYQATQPTSNFTNALQNSTNWSQNVGPIVENTLTYFGGMFGTGGREAQGAIIFVVFLVILVGLSAKGHMVSGLIIGYIPLLAGAWLGAPSWTLVGVITFIAAIFAIYKIWFIH